MSCSLCFGKALERRSVLEGLVEVDGTYVGDRAEGTVGRGAERKRPVAVALELRVDGKPGHVAMRSIERPDGHRPRRSIHKARPPRPAAGG